MITNKTLAILVITALLFSFGGTLFSLNKLGQEKQPRTVQQTTGRLVGIVNLSIGENIVCDVPNNISFGAGSQPAVSYMLSSEANNNANGFTADCSNTAPNDVCTGILINNTGNVEVNVSFYSNSNGTQFLGAPSTDLDYIYTWYNGTGKDHTNRGGCVQNASQPYGNWTNVTTIPTYVCRNLSYAVGNKQIVLEFNATIYAATTSGTKTSTLTITCQRP